MKLFSKLNKRILIGGGAIALGVLLLIVFGIFAFKDIFASADTTSSLISVSNDTTKFKLTNAKVENLMIKIGSVGGATTASVSPKLKDVYSNEGNVWTSSDGSKISDALNTGKAVTTGNNTTPLILMFSPDGLPAGVQVTSVNLNINHTKTGSKFAMAGSVFAVKQAFSANQALVCGTQPNCSLNFAKTSAGNAWSLSSTDTVYLGVMASQDVPYTISSLIPTINYNLTGDALNRGVVYPTTSSFIATPGTASWQQLSIAGPVKLPGTTTTKSQAKLQWFASDDQIALNAVSDLNSVPANCSGAVKCSSVISLTPLASQTISLENKELTAKTGSKTYPMGKYGKFVLVLWRPVATITPEVYNEFRVTYNTMAAPPSTTCPSTITFSPNSGYTGQFVTFNGLNFGSSRGTTYSYFSSSDLGANVIAKLDPGNTWSTSGTSFQDFIPTGVAPGQYYLFVKNATCTTPIMAKPSLTSTYGNKFNVVAAPNTNPTTCTINAIAKNGMPTTSVNQGDIISVNGLGFGPTGNQVFVSKDASAGSPLSVTSWSDSYIQALIPGTLAAGKYIRVDVKGTTNSCSKTIDLTVNGQTTPPPPTTTACTINSFSPALTAPRGLVNVSGVGFGAAQGQISLKLPTSQTKNAMTVKTWGDLAISAQVPEGLADGSYDIVVNGANSACTKGTLKIASYCPSVTEMTYNTSSTSITDQTIAAQGVNFGTDKGTVTMVSKDPTPIRFNQANIPVWTPTLLNFKVAKMSGDKFPAGSQITTEDPSKYKNMLGSFLTTILGANQTVTATSKIFHFEIAPVNGPADCKTTITKDVKYIIVKKSYTKTVWFVKTEYNEYKHFLVDPNAPPAQ